HVPPEYLRQDVWVRYDSREVRIFTKNPDGSLKQIQVHRRLEPGKFTNAPGIGGGQGSLQANLDYWLRRASELGPCCEGWARAVAQNRGIGGMRTDRPSCPPTCKSRNGENSSTMSPPPRPFWTVFSITPRSSR